MRMISAVFALVMMFSSAWAQQHRHGAKGPNGGPLEDIAGVHAELIADGNAITFNVFDEDSKPIKTAGYSGSVLVVYGADRETVQLSPFGVNSLKGQAKQQVAAGAAVTLMIKTDNGKTGQAKYKR